MKQQNFLFVELISSIFLLVLLVGNFMGLLYITDGSIVISFLGSMFLIVCYHFVVKLLSKNKEAMVRNNFKHGSILFWGFFILLGLVSFFLMSHFINIEYNCKDEIKNEATRKINIVDSVKTVYEKRAKNDVQNFGAELKNKLTQYKITPTNPLRNGLSLEPFAIESSVLNGNPIFIDVNAVANAKTTPYEIKIDNNIKNLDSTIKLNSGNYQSIFDNWKRFSLVASYSKLNRYVEENIEMVNEKIKELPMDKSILNIIFDKDQLPLSNPLRLNKLYPPKLLIPVLVILIVHLFILIPFFTQKIKGYPDKKHKLDPLEIENVREI